MKRLLFSIVAVAMSISAAHAIDFTQPLRQIDGSPVVDNDGKPLAKQPTLGTIVENALLAQYADERDPATGKETISPQEKYDRWKLAAKIEGNKEVALSAEDLALIKKLIGKGYAPLIVGQVLDHA